MDLGQLSGYSQSAGLTGEEGHDLVIGRSWDPGASRATIWQLTGEEGHDYTVGDINMLVVGDNVPTLTDAAGLIIFEPPEVCIAANGVAEPLGGYSLAQAGEPHAYILTEIVPAPALSSHKSFAVLAALLVTIAAIGLGRRGLRGLGTRA
jgi:hypothetical protein